MQAKKLKKLRAAIAAIEANEAIAQGGGERGVALAASPSVPPVPVPPVLPGAVHEWFGLADSDVLPWVPPLAILVDLVRRNLEQSGRRRVVWIGRRCWPYVPCLDGDGRLLRESIFIDPPDDASRLWAIDLAARCPAAAAVVADGSRLDMAATRRLQLAAEAGSALVLCARPPRELKHLSAASTRWLVRSALSTSRNPRWVIEPLRCKGMMQVLSAPSGRRWTVEWKCAQGSVAVHAALPDRPDPAARPQVRRTA